MTKATSASTAQPLKRANGTSAPLAEHAGGEQEGAARLGEVIGLLRGPVGERRLPAGQPLAARQQRLAQRVLEPIGSASSRRRPCSLGGRWGTASPRARTNCSISVRSSVAT
jgi:hypothetical protein